MPVQMNLLAPQPPSAAIEVPVCHGVLFHGAEARAEIGRGPRLFPHRHVPPMPRKFTREDHWLAALDFAEDCRRYNQASTARLDLSARDGAGSNGPCGRCGPGVLGVWADGGGIRVGDSGSTETATWPQLLRARREQREAEFEVAVARDLAEGYHCLHYYGGVYPEPEPGDTWTPIPLIRRIADEVRRLGGDPGLVPPRSTYMKEAVAE